MGTTIREWQDPADHSGSKLKEFVVECTRGFRLKVCDGPLVDVKVGDRVSLVDRYLLTNLFLADKVRPLDPIIPETGEYIAWKAFIVVMDGLYKQIHKGDIVELSRAEAIYHLKRLQVRPVDDTKFFI